MGGTQGSHGRRSWVGGSHTWQSSSPDPPPQDWPSKRPAGSVRHWNGHGQSPGVGAKAPTGQDVSPMGRDARPTDETRAPRDDKRAPWDDTRAPSLLITSRVLAKGPQSQSAPAGAALLTLCSLGVMLPHLCPCWDNHLGTEGLGERLYGVPVSHQAACLFPRIGQFGTNSSL